MAWSKYDLFLIYDSPIPYKQLQIYPATVKDYIYLHYFATCLLLDKNSERDVEIISMSYLNYLFYLYYVKKETQHIELFFTANGNLADRPFYNLQGTKQ